MLAHHSDGSGSYWWRKIHTLYMCADDLKTFFGLGFIQQFCQAAKFGCMILGDTLRHCSQK